MWFTVLADIHNTWWTTSARFYWAPTYSRSNPSFRDTLACTHREHPVIHRCGWPIIGIELTTLGGSVQTVFAMRRHHESINCVLCGMMWPLSTG